MNWHRRAPGPKLLPVRPWLADVVPRQHPARVLHRLGVSLLVDNQDWVCGKGLARAWIAMTNRPAAVADMYCEYPVERIKPWVEARTSAGDLVVVVNGSLDISRVAERTNARLLGTGG